MSNSGKSILRKCPCTSLKRSSLLMKLATTGVLLCAAMVMITLQGKPAICDWLLIKGERYNAISAMCMDGVLDVQIKEATVGGNEFCNFLGLCLLPQLLPFNRTNPRSVVVMDNASVHHVEYAASSCVSTPLLPRPYAD